ncbi:MAG: hypothetical protein WC735_01905 [Candidatus Paceibacterota bacterium]|jgi:hypothetical protein
MAHKATEIPEGSQEAFMRFITALGRNAKRVFERMKQEEDYCTVLANFASRGIPLEEEALAVHPFIGSPGEVVVPAHLFLDDCHYYEGFLPSLPPETTDDGHRHLPLHAD